jgi:anti-sigma B factor antagonist
MRTETPSQLLEVDRTHGLTVRFPNCSSLTDINVDAVGAEISRLADEHGRHIGIDLGNIEFLSSSALGTLLLLHKRFRSIGGRLTLQNIQPMVREVFAVTRLDQVIDLFEPSAQPEVPPT